ncbi:MAG: carbohydrate-binding protein [Candidatus Nanopelagicales bacterium]
MSLRRIILTVTPAQQAAANAAVAAATGNPADAYTFTVPRYDSQGVIVAYICSWDMIATGHDLQTILDAVTPTAPAATDVRKWAAGQTVRVGDQRWHDGELFTVIQAHTTQSDWAPTATPALWKQHRADLAAWVQPTGAHDAYPLGAKVTFKGKVYESKIPANVWSPAVYPAGWTDLGPAV